MFFELRAPHQQGEAISVWDLPYEQIFKWSGITSLILLSGCFAGLTLGLMSLDKIGLEVSTFFGFLVNTE
jgi:hypothetical protein